MKIVFMGTPPFAATVLERLIDEGHQVVLVVSQPDSRIGRKKELVMTPVKQVAIKHRIPTFQPTRIKKDHQAVIDVNPDLIITAAYGQIIPQPLLDAPQLGCINVHASLLPKYRGGAPIHQAIIDGESETGVTIMYMDLTMDTGDIITQARIPITDDDDVGTLFEKLSHVGSDLLLETLPAIQGGTNPRIPQLEEDATYAYIIKREDEWVDWKRSARAVFNQIRGLNPWPTAYTKVKIPGMEIFVKAFVSKELEATSTLEPGTIVNASGEGIDVVCGDGKLLRVLELQLAGKRRMPIKDLLNGDHPFKVGTKLGD